MEGGGRGATNRTRDTGGAGGAARRRDRARRKKRRTATIPLGRPTASPPPHLALMSPPPTAAVPFPLPPPTTPPTPTSSTPTPPQQPSAQSLPHSPIFPPPSQTLHPPPTPWLFLTAPRSTALSVHQLNPQHGQGHARKYHGRRPALPSGRRWVVRQQDRTGRWGRSQREQEIHR